MNRRKNFLFQKPKRYELRVYVYGKKPGEKPRERNIKVAAKSDDFRELIQGFKSGHLQYLEEYPYVGVYDTETGQEKHVGGSGRKFNPRKKRKTPKRRDAYAEMAKARKTTRGHKRKDRKRAVKRGSSRKAKHKLRLNAPQYEQPNTQPAAFDASVQKRRSKIIGIYRGFRAALEREGVKNLPALAGMRDDALKGAVLIESTRYPELRSQSQESKGAQAVALEALSLGPDGYFAEYIQEYPEIFQEHLKDTVEVLRKERKKLRSKQSKVRKEVKQYKEESVAERIKKLEARERAAQAQLDALDEGDEDDEGELDSATAADFAAEFAEEEQLEEVKQREEAVAKTRKKSKKKRKTKDVEYVEDDYAQSLPTAGMSKEKMARLGKYWKHLSPVRRTDVQPPLKLLGDTRQDVLLYILKDGTTQVWMKGSMTVTFEPSAKLPSWTIAHRYANQWRGLSPSGSIRKPKPDELPIKKSRLRTGVYAAVEGENKLKKLEDPIRIVEKKDRTLKRKQYDMPDLDKYELIGDRANPRRRRSRHPIRFAESVENIAYRRRRKNARSYKWYEDWPSQIGPHRQVIREYEAGAVERGWPSNIQYIAEYGPFEIHFSSGYVDFAGMGRHSQPPSWKIKKDGKYHHTIYDSEKQAIREVREAIKASAGRIRTVGRRKNVPFGKGKPERNHPYANTLRSAGLKYSHSVPVTHVGGKVYHHVYRLGDTDFYVSYYQKPGAKKWLWEGSVSGSGRMHQGFGMSALAKYLRGAVPRHSQRYPGRRRTNPSTIDAEILAIYGRMHDQGKCLGCGPHRKRRKR